MEKLCKSGISMQHLVVTQIKNGMYYKGFYTWLSRLEKTHQSTELKITRKVVNWGGCCGLLVFVS